MQDHEESRRGGRGGGERDGFISSILLQLSTSVYTFRCLGEQKPGSRIRRSTVVDTAVSHCCKISYYLVGTAAVTASRYHTMYYTAGEQDSAPHILSAVCVPNSSVCMCMNPSANLKLGASSRPGSHSRPKVNTYSVLLYICLYCCIHISKYVNMIQSTDSVRLLLLLLYKYHRGYSNLYFRRGRRLHDKHDESSTHIFIFAQ